MRGLLIIFFLTFLLSPDLKSQESNDSTFWQANVLFDLDFAIAFPVGPFQRELDRNLFGIGSSIFFNIHKNPGIFLGLSVSSFRFDSSFGTFPLFYDGLVSDYEVSTWNNLLQLYGTFRIMPPWKFRFTPFLEGSLGTKHLATRSEVYDPFFDSDESFDKYVEFGDWALSYGGAIGADYRVTSWGNIDLLIELAVKYFPGTGMDYNVLRSGDIGFVNEPLDAYEPRFSTTDLWQVNIGVTFAFGSNFTSD